MPHKRAKRSIREQSRAERKSDLPPSQSELPNDGIPKSVARVLNAEAIQKAFREKKRALELEDAEGSGKRKKRKMDDMGKSDQAKNNLKIKPGESLRHFRRRVEDDMRPVIRSAMKNTTSVSKQKSKESRKDAEQPAGKTKGKDAVEQTDLVPDSPSERKRRGKGKRSPSPDFARSSSSAPKRLNDIAQAPPEFKVSRLNRLVQKAAKDRSKDGDTDGDGPGSGVVSAAQKRMMELEREKAIVRYRALKEARLKEQQKSSGRDPDSF